MELLRYAASLFLFLALLVISLITLIALFVFITIAVFCWRAVESISEKLPKKLA